MKTKTFFRIAFIIITLPILTSSCGSNSDKDSTSTKSSSKNASSGIEKVVSMANDYQNKLLKIKEEAENNQDNVDKITKLIQEYDQKEKEFNKEFVDFVSQNAGKFSLPVEQNIHKEFYEVKELKITKAEDLEHVFAELSVDVIKSPNPNVQDRIYLAFKDKSGQTVGSKVFMSKPLNTPDDQDYKWEPRLYMSQLTGVVKVEVISEEDYKAK